MSEADEVAALLHERSVYEWDGKADDVAVVDEQLRLRGLGPDGKPLPRRSRNT